MKEDHRGRGSQRPGRILYHELEKDPEITLSLGGAGDESDGPRRGDSDEDHADIGSPNAIM